MKKFLSVILVLSILSLSALFLVGCSGDLSGKYTSNDGGIAATYEFSGNSVKYYKAGVLILEGKYETSLEEIIFTYKMDGEEFSLTESFFKYSDKVEIGGKFYIKE